MAALNGLSGASPDIPTNEHRPARDHQRILFAFKLQIVVTSFRSPSNQVITQVTSLL